MKKAMKKLLSAGISVLLLAGSMTVLPVSAADAYNVEMITNGDFELADEELAPVGWTTGKSTGSGGTVTVKDETLRLKATNGSVAEGTLDTSLNVHAYQRYPYVKPTSGESVVSVKIMIKSLEAGSYVLIDSNKNGFGASNSMGAEIKISETTDGRWVTYESIITKNQTADSFLIYVRLFGTGEAYVDDFSVQNKNRLISGEIDTLTWVFDPNEGTQDDFVVMTNEDLVEAGENFTAFSGNACIAVRQTGSGTTRPMYKFGSTNTPQEGVLYRISLRFRPLTAESTTTGPKVMLYTTHERGKNWYPKALSTTLLIESTNWIVGNVKDGWTELSAYFVMHYLTAEHTYVRMSIWNSCPGYIDGLRIEGDFEEPARIMNSNFEDITSAKPGDTIKVRAHAIAEKTIEQGGEKPAVILMRYTEENGARKCVEIKIAEKAIASDNDYPGMTNATLNQCDQAADDIVLEYTIPQDAAGSVIRAFAWDGADTLSPIGKADFISVNAN